MSKLYIGATPIGNINQISNELLDIFFNIKYIFCEDTRVTKKLFNLLNINLENKIFIPNHNFNENTKINEFAQIIKNNDVLLVSDAGYPLISDPGYNIVDYCVNNNIEIYVSNGPCAIIHSIVKSGFNINSFMFVGFLDNSKQKQINKLNELKNINTVFVLYESVHKIINTLKNINQVFHNNNLCVCKELTKLNEKYYYGTANEIIAQLDDNNLKGEFVIIINNIFNKKNSINELINVWKIKIDKLKKYGLSNKSILDFLLIDYPEYKNVIYKLLVDGGNDNE